MTPQRIQMTRQRPWRHLHPDAVIVARPSKWGNPFRIYHGHSSIGPRWHVAVDTWFHIPADECVYGYVTSSSPLGPEAVVALYRDVIKVRLRDEPDRLRAWLAPLAGRDLACWCPLEDAQGGRVPCHADVLLEIANGGDPC